MYYPDEVIEEVRMKNDIVRCDFRICKAAEKGANYFGLCPFHNEKIPSFSVSPGKQMYIVSAAELGEMSYLCNEYGKLYFSGGPAVFS